MTEPTCEHDPKTYAIIGAMEVHSALRSGFLEAVYLDAFALELSSRNIEFRREYSLTEVLIEECDRPFHDPLLSHRI